MPELLGLNAPIPSADDAFEGEVTCIGKWRVRDSNPNFWFPGSRSNKGGSGEHGELWLLVGNLLVRIFVDELRGVWDDDNVFGKPDRITTLPTEIKKC
ncbi:hypothetical protein JHK82_028761 [Glycine max]|nr:hypothetical protein JHK82_028761 [Glycine max]KAG5152540.1 hypothetical protein JHK84_029012 [Glycine max]